MMRRSESQKRTLQSNAFETRGNGNGEYENRCEAGIFFDKEAGGDGFADVRFGEAEVGGAIAF